MSPSLAVALGRDVERGIAASSTPSPQLWVDIGTSFRTLSKWDLELNASLVVVGVDPRKDNIEHAYQPKTPRFVRIHGACSEGPPGFATFYLHKSPTCGSLHATRKDAPTVGRNKDACIGDVPTPTRVPTFPLRLLLRQLPAGRRVELLKIDVQGAELACLRSAGTELRRVDNILLEVQDAAHDSRLVMYEDAPTVPELDMLLAAHGHIRQYCEWNVYTKELREINCLYSVRQACSRASDTDPRSRTTHTEACRASSEPCSRASDAARARAFSASSPDWPGRTVHAATANAEHPPGGITSLGDGQLPVAELDGLLLQFAEVCAQA